MSEHPGQDPFAGAMGGMGGMGAGQQPSEEQMRQAMGQMRATPVDQFVAGALQELLTAAQVKMGRNDGRLLLDLVAVLNDGTRGQIDAELTGQVDDALQQLRMGQVQAEREIVNAATEGHVEQNDLPRRPAPIELKEREQPPAPEPATESDVTGSTPPAAGGEEGSAPEQTPQQPPKDSASSRLWVPGR